MAESSSAVTQPPLTPMESMVGFLGRLPLSGRTGLLVAVVATVLALSVVIWFATRPDYKVLFSGLPQDETGRVVEQLNKMNVPYQLGPGATSIDVPADQVYDLRLEMATLGFPKQGSGVGFELFDKGNLVGMTDFMQRMNYQRALQGELARTIESLASVHSARVHLVLPKRSMFVTEERVATASVVMELARPLQASQSEGIVYLVASAVEGLDESQVTLLDHKGNLVSGGRAAPTDGRMPADETVALQQRVEKSLEDRAQAMLDKVVGVSISGVSRSIVRITAELDLSRVERHEESYNPEGQVPRSEQTVTENSRGTFGVGGVPGVRPNDANDASGAGASGSDQSRNVERETINYEISKTINKVLLPVGTIKRLSVAVLVDGSYEREEGKGGEPVYQERSTEELARLQKIIEQAVGFRKDRGDTIQVTSARFKPIVPGEDSVPGFWSSWEFWLQLGLIVAILALLFVVLKPMVEELLMGEREPDSSGVPAAVAELEALMAAEGVGAAHPGEVPRRARVPDRSIQMLTEMIDDHPEEAREIVRGWMAQD